MIPAFSKTKAFLIGVGLLSLTIAATLVIRGTVLRGRATVEVELSSLESREGRFVVAPSDQPFSGRVVAHDSAGRLRSSAQVLDGVLHGLSEGWFTNGVLQVREEFVRGISHGARTKWRDDGSVESEAAIQNGVIEGRFARWHANGALAEEAFFEKGVPVGEARMWHADGTLASWCRLERGTVADSRRWPPGECHEWPVAVAKAP